MSQLPIDLDAEAIQYDSHWYTREELARRIKQMLDSGDFAVGKPSMALEQLTTVVASLRTLAFRLPPEMADQLNQVAARHGRTLGSLIRESLTVHLNLKGMNLLEGSMTAGVQPLPSPPPMPDRPPGLGRKITDPEMQAAVRNVTGLSVGSHPTPPGGIPMSALPADLRMTQPMQAPSSGIAGGSGLKSAPPPSVLVDKSTVVPEEVVVEDTGPGVSLGGVKKKQQSPQDDDDDTIERGWFGR